MLEVRGRLISIGSARSDEPPRATIVIREEDEDQEALSLDIDLDPEQAIELASNLFGYMKISIEACEGPAVGEPKGPRLVKDQ